MRAPPSSPKRGSGAFKQEWARLLRHLDLPRMIVVLEGAADRGSLEEILRKAMKGRALRPGALARAELVAAVAETSRVNDDVAFLVVRELDRACQRERHLVASMAEDDLDTRLESYRAIDFRRERARLIWALLRDGRPAHETAALRVLQEAFDAMGKALAEKAAIDDAKASGAASAGLIEGLEQKLGAYEQAIAAQGQLVHDAKSEQEKIEHERSVLVVKLGERERALKVEEQRRREAEEEVHRLREEVHALKESIAVLDPGLVDQKDKEIARLREKTRSLEAKVEHAERLAALQEENEALRAELFEARQKIARTGEEQRALLVQLATRDRAAQDRVSSLRESLKTARKLAAAERDPSHVDGEVVGEERVGVFIDAANLQASARRTMTGKLDFVALLAALVGERRRAIAVAFVVDNDARARETNASDFAGFVRALQAGGYEVRQKRPKVRADGTTKADWDMGIAMEILDARHRVDTIVLGSGDGDFLPLVQRLKRWGKRVELASFVDATDPALARVVDEHVALDRTFLRA